MPDFNVFLALFGQLFKVLLRNLKRVLALLIHPEWRSELP